LDHCPRAPLAQEVNATTPTTPSTVIAVPDLVFTDPERLALASFIAGYRGLTRDAYALDLRQFVAWCERHGLKLFSVRRADIEPYARALEEAGRARATVARRLCTVAGFYRYAQEEGLVPVSPAVHVRRPRLDYESHAIGLDRNEVGALLVAAGLGAAVEHALISLLALNGLRVSEAIGADIEALGLERGHRTLTVLRKGGKVVTVPLAPRTARAVDLAIGERLAGPIFLGANGQRMDRHGAGRIVRRVARRAGVNKPIRPHTLRHAFITAALDAGVPLRDVQEAASHSDPRDDHEVRPREGFARPSRDICRCHVDSRRQPLAQPAVMGAGFLGRRPDRPSAHMRAIAE
jgi:integrase/recombinase XerD